MGVNQSNQSNKIIGAYSYQLIDQIKEKQLKHLNKELLFNYNSTLLLVNQGFAYHIFQIKSQSLKSLTIIQHSMYNQKNNKNLNMNGISKILFVQIELKSQLQIEEKQKVDLIFLRTLQFISNLLQKIKQFFGRKLKKRINNRKIIYKFNTPIQVNCIILNNAENQIIAGGYEKILILNIQNGLQLYQQFSISNQWITDLSISEFDTYLAINSSQNYILIIEQCLKDTSIIWQEIQKIEIQSNYSKSIFTNNNNLIIKQKDKELLFIYEYNIQDQQFNYVKEFELKGKSHKFSVEPLKFNQQLKILAITNNNNVNFVKIINSDNFELQQILNSKHETIGGALSQDGVYFALLTQQNCLFLYQLMKM